VEEYLKSPSGLGLGPENVRSWFDDLRTPAEILGEVEAFLVRRGTDLGSNQPSMTDLLLYYVGHGSFVGPDNKYALYLPYTREATPLASALLIEQLAEMLRESARHVRKYLILDACFSGAARKGFQGTSGDIVWKELELASSGVALFSSSSARRPSRAPRGQALTMFTGAFLDVIRGEYPGLGEALSLRDVRDLTDRLIAARHREQAVRPELHSPQQEKGDLLDVPLFPNSTGRTTRGSPREPDVAVSDPAPDSPSRQRWRVSARTATAVVVGLSLATGVFLSQRAGRDNLPPGLGTLATSVGLSSPVTNSNFRQFLEETGIREAERTLEALSPTEAPVSFVDWHNASRFCEWRGDRLGDPASSGRLPTEAEWRRGVDSVVPGAREWTSSESGTAPGEAITCYASDKGSVAQCMSRQSKNSGSDELLFRCAL